ncbi:MAG: hypothetical protein M3297_01735 [Thermoproteota archaeon]|nr:hypothetical protein [Thermoproteota archaeon]
MSRVRLRKIRAPVGRLFEYTTAYNMPRPMKFGIVDIEGIKVIGYLDSTVPLCIGTEVIMTRCGISLDGTPFYEFHKYEKGSGRS